MKLLRPIEHSKLVEAADLIENFRLYWDQCDSLENPGKARKQLIQKVVDRVFVRDGNVLAVALQGGISVILSKDEHEKEAMMRALKIKMGYECVS